MVLTAMVDSGTAQSYLGKGISTILRPCETQISIFFKSTFKRLFGKRRTSSAPYTETLYADFFLDNSIGFFMRYPCLKSGQLQRSTYRQYGFHLIK